MAWIFLNDAFLSIVKSQEKTGHLLVRGRAPGDIETVFPNAKVQETRARDYRFRTTLPAREVAQAVGMRILGIDYPNFKGSVRGTDRHDAYLGVWGTMWRFQNKHLHREQDDLWERGEGFFQGFETFEEDHRERKGQNKGKRRKR